MLIWCLLLSLLKTVMLLNIFVEIVIHFFFLLSLSLLSLLINYMNKTINEFSLISLSAYFWWIELKKHLFKIEIFCNIKNIFTVTFINLMHPRWITNIIFKTLNVNVVMRNIYIKLTDTVDSFAQQGILRLTDGTYNMTFGISQCLVSIPTPREMAQEPSAHDLCYYTGQSQCPPLTAVQWLTLLFSEKTLQYVHHIPISRSDWGFFYLFWQWKINDWNPYRIFLKQSTWTVMTSLPRLFGQGTRSRCHVDGMMWPHPNGSM